MKHHN